MNEPKWTKGPWIVDNGAVVIASGEFAGTPIVLVPPRAPLTSKKEEADANARLIASAPKLYEALMWAFPLARLALEDHRKTRLRAGHRMGTKQVGLYDEEVQQMEDAAAALAQAREET